MKEEDEDLAWLGDLRWKGYPHLQPIRDRAAETPAVAAPASIVPPAPPQEPVPDPRLGELARENETLRSRLDALGRLAFEFERRLKEAGNAYEGAVLEAESRLRDAILERERLTGELQAAKAESLRLAQRDATRDAELRLERERRGDAEKALAEARRQVADLTERAERLRAAAAEQAGAVSELRRQASGHAEKLIHAKEMTDQDVATLRQEFREFLAKFHRIQENFGEKA